MLQTTTWHPDTCACAIEYTWDSSVPAEERVHTASRIVRKCAAHSSIGDHHAHFSLVLEENQRKNKVLGAVTADLPVDIKWRFDVQRVLHVELPNITPEHKATIQEHVDAEHGPGKVAVT